MIYSAKQYTRALLELSKTASQETLDDAVQELERQLSRQGKKSLMKQIVKDLQKAYDKEQGIAHITVTLPTRAKDYAQEITDSFATISTATHVETKYDETIISGARVLADSQWYIDATVDGSLQKLSDQLHNK